jgi:bacillopeptidase F
MKSLRTLSILVLLTVPCLAESAILSARQSAVLSPALAARFDSDSAGTMYDALVSIRSESVSPQHIQALAASAPDLHGRYRRVLNQLQAAATATQSNWRTMLSSLPGHAEFVQGYWLSDIVRVHANREALSALADRGDVNLIAPNVTIELLSPVGIADATSASVGAESNLQAVGARALWSHGLTGKGRIVASIDTGVEGVHPALADRWRGRHGDTTAAWYDPSGGRFPIDNNGHGTHVMGIMCGRDGADTIGLAPDAEWICAAVVDRGSSLAATFADIISALQWVVDPDGNPETFDDVPDVVCNSWGVSQQIISPCDSLFFDAIDHVEAMGVVCVFAAGNEGPYSMSIRNPADRAISPTASFAVGAADATQPGFPIPGFSSRGPSACDGVSIKPQIVAPGVSIRSAFKGQTYKLISGTSMAAPHVAAAVALLRQYNPELTPEQIKTALLATAQDLGTPGEDNASGHGLLDLQAALQAAPAPSFPIVLAGAVSANPQGDGIASVGEVNSLVVPISVAQAPTQDVTLAISALTTGVMIAASSAHLGVLPVGATVDNTGSPFQFTLPDDFRAGDTVMFELRISGDPMIAMWRDTVALMCGLPPGARVQNLANGASRLGASNFGQLGLADGSCLNAGGAGWTSSYWSGNVLHDGALIIASEDGWSDASRRASGESPFDFAPEAAAPSMQFDDQRASIPVGVRVTQSVANTVTTSQYEYFTLAWTIENRRGLPIHNLQVGWLWDIDSPKGSVASEAAHLDPASTGVYHTSGSSPAVAGYAPMTGAFGSRQFFWNTGGSKRMLSEGEKRNALSGLAPAPAGQGDLFELVATSPVSLGANDTVTVAITLISARDAGAFAAAAVDARNQWLRISDVGGDHGGIRPPTDFRLEQNYPNPFNAGTTIPVVIGGSATQSVRLDIVNILGQQVRTLIAANLEPGSYSLSWDGRDESGSAVASGVYFSRLTGPAIGRQVRQMVLLK